MNNRQSIVFYYLVGTAVTLGKGSIQLKNKYIHI